MSCHLFCIPELLVAPNNEAVVNEKQYVSPFSCSITCFHKTESSRIQWPISCPIFFTTLFFVH